MSIIEVDILQERYELATDRIRELVEELSLPDNKYLPGNMTEFFAAAVRYLSLVISGADTGDEKQNGCDNRYLRPEYAVRNLGDEHGRLLSWLFYELHCLESLGREGSCKDMVIRLELFLEIYAAFVYEWHENGKLPEYEAIRRIMYWFAFDYADVAAEQYVDGLIGQETEGHSVYLESESILYGFLPLETVTNEEHREDAALIIDKAYLSRKLEVFRTALEKKKVGMTDADMERLRAVAARLDTEKAVAGVQKKPDDGESESCIVRFTREQRALWQEYCHQAKKYVAHLA